MLDWIHVDGDRLADHRGGTVVLTGFGLGGWLNMENFIAGFPATETLARQALRRALGPQGYRRFFDRFEAGFFTDADAAYLRSLGCNSVRLPVNYRHLEDDAQPFEIRPEGLRLLDEAIAVCRRNELWLILDLHALPGFQNQHWHCDNPTHQDFFWDHRHFQDRVVHLWQVLAQRYRDEPTIAGYNPINEPADPTGARLAPFYQRLAAAIREVDPRHVLFLDGNTYSTDFSMFEEPLDNAVYTAHDYARPGMVAGADYPGTVEGRYYDRATLADVFARRTEFQRRTGTPIWIGECGPQYTGDPVLDEHRRAMLRDQLEIYREAGASWSLWTYKDLGLQGVQTVAPGSSYARRVAGVVAAKARLGTDSWGGDDRQVRYLLDPVMELFAREFPEFDPYPWGAERWVSRLFCHILLAEPLVSVFEAAFRGSSPDEAERDAACFEFDRCVEQPELAALLRAHHGVG